MRSRAPRPPCGWASEGSGVLPIPKVYRTFYFSRQGCYGRGVNRSFYLLGVEPAAGPIRPPLDPAPEHPAELPGRHHNPPATDRDQNRPGPAKPPPAGNPEDAALLSSTAFAIP